jgi:SPP1 family predicted phage head-tail adaptor
MANPGDFRHLVDVVGPVAGVSDDAGGWTVGSPETVVSGAWASIEALTGTEQLRAMATTAEASHRITLREWYDGVTSAMWVEFEDRTFKIVAPPVDPEEKREMLVLITREDV